MSSSAVERLTKLVEKYVAIRRFSCDICSPLETEDYVVQPRDEVSPPKWHLAHVTWFFEELILCKFFPQYKRFNDAYRELFNSYYKSASKHWLQAERGVLSRPTVNQVLKYRQYVDDHLVDLCSKKDLITDELIEILEIGLHHEQQHQELLFMDIKAIFAVNPLLPVYCERPIPPSQKSSDRWHEIIQGIYEIGHDDQGFSYDNETPRHKSYLESCKIRSNLVSNAEYLNFVEDGGYQDAKLWLSLGWDWLEKNKIKQPLYWFEKDKEIFEFSLHGLKSLNPTAPVTHISYFEADAFARWKGCRLPSEAESETFLAKSADDSFQAAKDIFQPYSTLKPFENVWWWTASHYSPYPGYRPFNGVLQEYNGKFMCNQFVLRGGCQLTPKDHYRHSYRNFYLPHQRWMFSGIRLAKDD